jgi:putative tricarboxylic transport membrane protein
VKRGEIVVSAGSLAFFAFMLQEATALRAVGRFGELGSGFWPMLALGACVCLSSGWLVSAVRQHARERGTAVAPPTADGDAEAWRRRRKVALSVVCLLLYVVALPWIGFVLSTLAFVLLFTLAVGETRRRVLAVSPVVVTAIIVLVFARFITIPLPRGAGVFAGFSRLFY